MTQCNDDKKNEWEVYERHCKGEFESIRKGQEALCEKFDSLCLTILGNGKKGIVTKQAEAQKDIDDLRKGMQWFVGVGTAIFIVVAGRFLWLLMSHIGDMQ